MTARLGTALIVGALIRRVSAEGGNAVVLARGDADAGGILILATERGGNPAFFERGLGPSGASMLVASGPAQLDTPADAADYWQRRRARDPDLWVVELDVAGAERFAAEILFPG